MHSRIIGLAIAALAVVIVPNAAGWASSAFPDNTWACSVGDTGSGCTSTTMKPMPFGGGLTASATGSDGRLYLFGGTINNSGNGVLVYNTAQNTWACFAADPQSLCSITTIAPMPTGRTSAAAATGSDGRIYVIGGSGASGTLQTVEAYDPVANTWACSVGDTSTGCSSTSLQPMPTARSWFGSAASNGRIYAIGGISSACPNYCSLVEAYDPATNTWTCSKGDPASGCTATTLAPLPKGGADSGVTSDANGTIYVSGGDAIAAGHNYTARSLALYSPTSNTWKLAQHMLDERSGGGAAVGPDGRFYAVGGSGYHGLLSAVDAYSSWNNSWRTVAPLPTPRSGASVLTGPDGRIYALDGVSSALVEAYTVNPSMSFQPAFGASQTSITATGLVFQPTETVTLYMDSTSSPPLTATTTGATGSFTAHFTVPSVSYGTHSVIAVGAQGDSTTTRFTVTAKVIDSPTSGTQGSTASMSGTGYGANEQVTFKWNCKSPTCTSTTVLGTATADSNGSFTNAPITIPTATVGTVYPIGAQGNTTRAFASVNFTVMS